MCYYIYILFISLKIEPGKQPFDQPHMPEPSRPHDPLEQMFTNMVGPSGEIDQYGLKQILDALMSQCKFDVMIF